MKLIPGWKTSYKLFSVQMSLAVILWSAVDGLMRMEGMPALPVWVYSVSGILLVLLRNVAQLVEKTDG